ncbi:MAG: SDR family oxidoreductase [Mycobacteriales bacterium]
MASLERFSVVVAGGAGAVGEGIVAALLDAGATVAVPSRDESKLDALRERVGGADRLLGVVGDAADPVDADRVRDDIVAAIGPPDAVIVSVGGWSSGPKLADIPLPDWDTIMARNLRTHQVIASTYLPLLRGRSGAAYAVIIGDTAQKPTAGAGPVSVTAAAELMAARVLGLEESEAGVQVIALVLAPVITRNRPKGPPGWLTAREVGEALASLLVARVAQPTAGDTSIVDLPARPSANPDGSAG